MFKLHSLKLESTNSVAPPEECQRNLKKLNKGLIKAYSVAFFMSISYTLSGHGSQYLVRNSENGELSVEVLTC